MCDLTERNQQIKTNRKYSPKGVRCLSDLIWGVTLYKPELKTYPYLYGYLTIRPVARKGYGAIAHEAKPNGLLIRGP